MLAQLLSGAHAFLRSELESKKLMPSDKLSSKLAFQYASEWKWPQKDVKAATVLTVTPEEQSVHENLSGLIEEKLDERFQHFTDHLEEVLISIKEESNSVRDNRYPQQRVPERNSQWRDDNARPRYSTDSRYQPGPLGYQQQQQTDYQRRDDRARPPYMERPAQQRQTYTNHSDPQLPFAPRSPVSGPRRNDIRECFRCHKFGHIARYCTEGQKQNF
jgi:hypothetical protein